MAKVSKVGKRSNLMICESCGAERKCSDSLRKAALRGDITCYKCAAKGHTGFFTDAKVIWQKSG